jgi:type I restriction enzyme, R subunit
MPSNFDFLKPDFPQLYNHATNAENLVHSAPRASCFYIRYTLEQAVHWLYANDPYLQLPYDDKLSALIHEQTFQDNLSPPISSPNSAPSKRWGILPSIDLRRLVPATPST